jgi:MFS family permease
MYYCCFEALIGVAFSVGFMVGPIIGAIFSQQARVHGSDGAFFITPALFALTLAVLNVVFLFVFMRETHPVDRRVCCHYCLTTCLYVRSAMILGNILVSGDNRPFCR